MPQQNNQKVMTAPLAIIQINGVTVGKMKNVRITETIRRGRVSGLGVLNPSELPALADFPSAIFCACWNKGLEVIEAHHLFDKDYYKYLNSFQGFYHFYNTILFFF